MQAQAPPFVHIDLGNIITWIFVGIAWVVTRSMDWRGIRDDMKWMKEWREKHQRESEVTEAIVREIATNSTRLTALAEGSERRVVRLENWRDMAERRQ